METIEKTEMMSIKKEDYLNLLNRLEKVEKSINNFNEEIKTLEPELQDDFIEKISKISKTKGKVFNNKSELDSYFNKL